jgi:BMFP domain-containing protein YqiC
MSFESFRGYVQLASGLGELTRARAMEAAQGLMSMPGVSVATGKFAVQVGALAEELLAAATTNREHLTTLVRGEVDAAVTRLGLVPAEKLEEARAEAARLRAEVAALRSASARSSAGTAKKTAVKKTAVKKTAVKKTAATSPVTKPTAARRSAVTTRRKPAGT